MAQGAYKMLETVKPHKFTIEGDATGATNLDATSENTIEATLAESGVTAGSYGPDKDQGTIHGSIISVPEITVNEKGLVTGAVTRSVTLPTNATSPVVLQSLAGERSVDIESGGTFTVPSYVVGSKTLEVYLNGLLCIEGTDDTVATYTEVGEAEDISTTITFLCTVSTEDEILVRII